MKDRLFEIWLSLRMGVANPAFIPLLAQYTPYDLFSMDTDAIAELSCDDKIKRALEDKNLEESHRIQRYCRQNGIGLLFWQDEAYPRPLKHLIDPPMLLYYMGKLPDFNSCLCISVVGTRTMSEYGKKMAYKIGYELAAVGTVVVSGMALGVDSVAAAGALAAKGCTVAILGCGIDIVYPVAHRDLRDAILQNGAVMTEYPPATRPLGHHFPQRNRIISGLSQGTVVVEAGESSGALITARTAISQGRDVFAVPGNVGDPQTSGTNRLIFDGAGVVLKPRDILDTYSFLYRDALRLDRLLTAEQRSDLDESVLERLSVYVRNPAVKATEKHREPPKPLPKANTPTSAESPERRSPRKSSETSQTEKQIPLSEPRVGDASEKILETLPEVQRKLFEALPLDHAVAVDYLVKAGFSMSDIMSAMTMLEIKGLVVALPGGLYSRK